MGKPTSRKQSRTKRGAAANPAPSNRRSTRNKSSVALTQPTEQKKDDQVCVCHGASEDTRMIACETCDNWYHFDCIGMDWRAAEEIGVYICDSCQQKTGHTSTMNWEDMDALVEKVNPTAVVNVAPDVDMEPPEDNDDDNESSDGVSAPEEVEEDSDSSSDGYVEEENTRSTQRRGKGRNAKRAPSSSGSEHTPPPTASGRRAPPQKSLKRRTSDEADPPSKKTKEEREETPPAELDPARKYCLGRLEVVLRPMFTQYRPPTSEDEENNQKQFDEEVHSFVTELEAELFKRFCDADKHGKHIVGQKYKDRFRMLTFNIEKKDRVNLRQRIASGKISPRELSGMSSVDLANEQQKQLIDHAAEESLKDSILEARAAPKAKITHKGEEMIESIGEEEDNARTRRAEAELEHEREAQSVRVKIQTDGTLLHSPTSPTLLSAGLSGTALLPDSLSTSPSLSAATLTGSSSPIIARRGSYDMDAPQSPILTKSPVSFDRPFLSLSSDEQPVESSSILTTSPITSSFDLNALSWTKSDQPEAPMGLSNSPKGMDSDLPLAKGNDTVDLDLDDLNEEPDFDVFLDFEPPSLQNTGGDHPEKLDLKLAKFQALPFVWHGIIEYPDGTTVTNCKVGSRQIGGRTLDPSSTMWQSLFPSDTTTIRGRVPIETSSSFLVQMRLSPSRELIAVAFTPTEGTNPDEFNKILQQLIDKKRHAVVLPWGEQPLPTAPGKELYLVPLRPNDPIPEFVELLDSMQLPQNRSNNVLLGIFILYRGRFNIPPPPTALPPTALPPTIPPTLPSTSTALPPLFPINPIPPPSQTPIMPPLPSQDELAKVLASVTPEQLELLTKLGIGGQGAFPPATGFSPPTATIPGFPPIPSSAFPTSIPSFAGLPPPIPTQYPSPPVPYQAPLPPSGVERSPPPSHYPGSGGGYRNDVEPRSRSNYPDRSPPPRRYSNDRGRDYPPRGRDHPRSVDSGWGSRGRGRGRGQGYRSPPRKRGRRDGD